MDSEMTTLEFTVLRRLAAGETPPMIAGGLAVTPQRCRAIMDQLRAKGFLSSDLPREDCAHKEVYTPQSRANPWPPAARWVAVFLGTSHEVLIRSVALPRLDEPDAIPESCAVVVSRPGYGGSVAFEVSRSRRWSVDATGALLADWATRAAQESGRIPPVVALGEAPIWVLTLALAWSAEVEAILYRFGRPQPGEQL